MSLHQLLHRLRGHLHAHPAGHGAFVGRKAASYDRASGWLMRPLYRAVARRVVDDLPPDGRVLDIGTGPGRLLLEIARSRPDAHVTGIDPSADMVAYAEQHARSAGLATQVAARVATAEELPFPDDSFDLVVSSLSAHHWADVRRAVTEQLRVLRPGGRLWICDLRASRAAVSAALHDSVAAGSLSRPALSWPASLLLACSRAAKPGDLTAR